MADTKQDKLQELQNLEYNLQNLIYQKQAFQMEFSETQSALKEIENSGDDVYKVIGQIMIKTEKEKIREELSNKKKILEMRIGSIEQQEKSITEKIEKIREAITKKEKDK